METQETRFILTLLLSMVVIALASSVVLLGPLYLLNMLPVRQPGSAWSISWASGTTAVFAAYYAVRRLSEMRKRHADRAA